VFHISVSSKNSSYHGYQYHDETATPQKTQSKPDRKQEVNILADDTNGSDQSSASTLTTPRDA